MDISDVVIVLCKPNEAKNIGSVCRAMFTMGLKRLRIVGKRRDYNDEEIRTLAVHAFHIWENADFFDTLPPALEDCVCAAGTTRRSGHKRGFLISEPRELSSRIFSLPDGSLAAVVFGNERTGLTDNELNACTFAVTIPAEPKAGSINLSHAVQIIAYELYRGARPLCPSAVSPPVPLSRLHTTADRIIGNLQKIGFFSLGNPDEMKRFWLSVLSRSAVCEKDVLYIEKIFHKAACLSLKNKADS
ncbi:RNA methyltransferase [Treponema sp. HNW]|uniref:RNA methyltransferase n=1 Tax=Treponema sp. HNW TaxID=3116654 RepID=UPI003D111597